MFTSSIYSFLQHTVLQQYCNSVKCEWPINIVFDVIQKKVIRPINENRWCVDANYNHSFQSLCAEDLSNLPVFMLSD